MEGQLQKQHGGGVHHAMEEQWQQHVGDDLDIGRRHSGMHLLWGHNHGGGGDHVMGDIDDAADGAAANTAKKEEVHGGGTSQESGRPAEVKRKRHRKEQNQQLEAMFRAVPHPFKNLHKVFSEKLGLTSMQVDSWFQNQRSSNKVDREEGKAIRKKNKMLREQNQAIRAAIIQKTCHTCGGPTVPIPETTEKRRLSLENASLKKELMRASAILSMITGKVPAVVRPVPVPGGLRSTIFGCAAGMPFLPLLRSAVADPMLFDPEKCVSNCHCAAGGNSVSNALQLHIQRAMDEFRTLVRKGMPMWLPTLDGDVLNCDEYAKATFPSILRQIPMGFAMGGTRDSGMVMGTAGDLAGIFMDATRWSDMFQGIVAGTLVSKLPIPSTSRHGKIQLMKAELRVLAPQVPVRKVKFIRQCEMLEPGVWVVVDVSADGVRIPEEEDGSSAKLHEQNCGTPARYMPCRVMLSGCLIKDLKNGYSKVTWIVIVEYDETTVPPLYLPLLRSSQGLGAGHWLGSLKRQCEYLGILHSDLTRSLVNTGGIPPERMNNVLQLAQRMMGRFYAGMGGQTWCSLDEWRGGHGIGSERVELAVRFVTISRAVPGEQQAPGSLVLTATTTAWLPGMPSHVVFDYLCDIEHRGEWDTLANGELVQKELYVATGHLHGNAVSVLRPKASDRTSNMLILQESRVDKSCMLLAYAPIGENSMVEEMNIRGDASAFLLPSGFVLLPDGHCSEWLVPRSATQHTANTHTSIQSNAGSVVSAMYQTLLSGPPHESISMESIDHIGKMLCRAMNKIKDAICANIVIPA